MIVEINKDASLFLAGELTVRILEGEAEIFGYPYKENDTVIIEKNRSAPMIPTTDSLKIEVKVGEGGYITYLEESLIPESWYNLVEELIDSRKGTKIMVLGSVDVGKTGFITFLANKFYGSGKKVAIVDADTGQSSIGPPTMIGLGIVEKPLVYLTNATLIDAYFVGSTTPANVFQRSIVGTYKMVKKAEDLDVDVIIIDTTGWVGDRGRELKISKINLVQPDYLILVESEFGELFHIAKPFMFSGIKIKNISPPPALRARSRDIRREIRQGIFSEYFENGEVKEVPISTVNLRYCYLGTGKPIAKEKLEELGIPINGDLYVEKSIDTVVLYLEDKDTLDPNIIEEIKTKLEVNNALIIDEETINGIVVSLRNKDDEFLGLGILKGFNPENRALEVYTNVDSNDIKTIEVGHIKANEAGEEQGHIPPWSI